MSKPLSSLVVGFGRAGRGLHFQTLRKMYRSGVETVSDPVFVLEPNAEAMVEDLPWRMAILDSIEQARSVLDAEHAVVHLCTPPGVRFRAVAELAEAGFRRFLIEKPFTDNPRDLVALKSLRAEADLDVLVVGNLLSSVLTQRVIDLVGDGSHGRLTGLHFDLRKPRFERSLSNSGHMTAFEIELPHAVTTALYLAGDALVIDDVLSEDMVVEGQRLPGLGSASLHLTHTSGAATTIHSDLRSAIRKRAATFTFERLVLDGHYAVSEADNFAQVTTVGGSGRNGASRHEILRDDTFLSFMVQAYEHFATGRPCPVGDFDRAARAADLICLAKARCDLAAEAVAS